MHAYVYTWVRLAFVSTCERSYVLVFMRAWTSGRVGACMHACLHVQVLGFWWLLQQRNTLRQQAATVELSVAAQLGVCRYKTASSATDQPSRRTACGAEEWALHLACS